MKTLTLATTAAIIAVAMATLGAPALASGMHSEAKIEARFITIDRASGAGQLSNGQTLNQIHAIQSASLQHPDETKGADQLQHKLRGQIRYIATDAKA